MYDGCKCNSCNMVNVDSYEMTNIGFTSSVNHGKIRFVWILADTRFRECLDPILRLAIWKEQEDLEMISKEKKQAIQRICKNTRRYRFTGSSGSCIISSYQRINRSLKNTSEGSSFKTRYVKNGRSETWSFILLKENRYQQISCIDWKTRFKRFHSIILIIIISGTDIISIRPLYVY